MVYKKISRAERALLETKIFNGYIYSRKRAAYQARAEYYSMLDKDEWCEMVKFFNFKCCNCKSEVIGGIPTKDHIIPITHGGTNCIRNLQPLCRECNTGNVKQIDYRVGIPEKWSLNGHK